MAKAGGKKHCNSGTWSATNRPKNKGHAPPSRMNILAALKRQGQTEDGFYDLMVKKAMDEDDQFMLKEVMLRLSPIPKAVAPLVEFEFPNDASFSEQAGAVLDAIARGIIPADSGSMFVTTIKSAIDIEEFTELKDRIEGIEASLGVQNV